MNMKLRELRDGLEMIDSKWRNSNDLQHDYVIYIDAIFQLLETMVV